MDEPDRESFFDEIRQLQVSNPLYREWADYVVGLSRSDVLGIVRAGLTHQADALRSMLRELVAGAQVPKSLLHKMDVVADAARRRAAILRR